MARRRRVLAVLAGAAAALARSRLSLAGGARAAKARTCDSLIRATHTGGARAARHGGSIEPSRAFGAGACTRRRELARRAALAIDRVTPGVCASTAAQLLGGSGAITRSETGGAVQAVVGQWHRSVGSSWTPNAAFVVVRVLARFAVLAPRSIIGAQLTAGASYTAPSLRMLRFCLAVVVDESPNRA